VAATAVLGESGSQAESAHLFRSPAQCDTGSEYITILPAVNHCVNKGTTGHLDPHGLAKGDSMIEIHAEAAIRDINDVGHLLGD